MLGGVGPGIGVDISRKESESELESLEICHLRSPDYNASKFYRAVSIDGNIELELDGQCPRYE